jgi:hypothetical protein
MFRNSMDLVQELVVFNFLKFENSKRNWDKFEKNKTERLSQKTN